VLTDLSSLYADDTGLGSVLATEMAVEDSGLTTKVWKIDVISGHHQNKPNVTVNSDIGSFSALTDQWSRPISVGGSPYYV
jgi:hypothetical protein